MDQKKNRRKKKSNHAPPSTSFRAASKSSTAELFASAESDKRGEGSLVVAPVTGFVVGVAEAAKERVFRCSAAGEPGTELASNESYRKKAKKKKKSKKSAKIKQRKNRE